VWTAIPRPIIFAHRGASAHAPENTLPAFQLALEHGANAIELDAKLSADGEVVVFHDTTLERTTNGRGRLAATTFADLRALDAGSFFSPGFRGTQIPSLAEVFERLGNQTIINVELTNYATPRDHLVQKVCDLVRKYRLEKSILFSSFFASNLRRAARRLPEVPRGLLALGGWMGAWARSFGFAFGDFAALHPQLKDVDARAVGRVHRLQRRIHVWTANRADDIVRLKELGVDGLFTDDPQLAGQVLGRIP
jgi:glycerophosphoryl diester phosphodiesterase